MMQDLPDLARLCAAAGVVAEYRDTTSQPRQTGPDSARAVLAAMGLPAATEAQARDSLSALGCPPAGGFADWVVVTAGVAADTAGPWVLTQADGTALSGPGGPLPPLPMGYHRLTRDGHGDTLVIAAPDRLPDPPRGWGITVPLYGLRTADQGGYGDYADLATALGGLGRAGADFVGINPIHAGFPTDAVAFSPYSPSSRQRLNTAHIALAGLAGTPGALIDYVADRPAHLAALRATFAALPAADRDAARATAQADPDLWRFATHQTLADLHGALWTGWPAALQDSRSPDIARFAARNGEAIAFHAWAQLEATRQLQAVRDAAAAAGMRHGLYLDLAVGTHPAGAETWADPDTFARGVSLGAPPDAFSPGGQSWGLAPFNPRALMQAGFAPFIDTLRAQFRFAKLLRIDHVLGFDRAFWVPQGCTPGAYVTMPKAALLAITRVEAARAGATVIGEDLGNVPDGLREDMAASGLLGCRVAMFERCGAPPAFRPGAAFDHLSLAAFSSHDLPAWAGWRTGRDLDWWARIGHLPKADLPAAHNARAAEVAAFDTCHGTANATPDALHRMLAHSAAALVALQAEDIFGLIEQPNLPGTIDAHPNWRRRLPVAAADLGRHPAILRTAALMDRTRHTPRKEPS